jgi:hypothetical protein
MSKKMSLEEALEVVRKAGIQVNTDTYSKKTFEVENRSLQNFVSTVKQKKLKMKDAITEAINDWLKKK